MARMLPEFGGRCKVLVLEDYARGVQIVPLRGISDFGK